MINQKYSFSDFTNKEFTALQSEEFSDTEIKGTCFYQELGQNDNRPADIFPNGTKNITFTNCNLDNVKLPPGSTLNGRSTNQLIKRQNDGRDWVLDNTTRKPIRVKGEKQAIKDGLNTDPDKIPGGPI